MPGILEDGSFDPELLRSWISRAINELGESGRQAVGEIHLGHVLSRVPPDIDGQWPNKVVREILEELQSERIERGVEDAVLNDRGVTTRSLDEGGTQEEELAQKYIQMSNDFSDTWPRTARVLRSIAGSYENQARREGSPLNAFEVATSGKRPWRWGQSSLADNRSSASGAAHPPATGCLTV